MDYFMSIEMCVGFLFDHGKKKILSFLQVLLFTKAVAF